MAHSLLFLLLLNYENKMKHCEQNSKDLTGRATPPSPAPASHAPRPRGQHGRAFCASSQKFSACTQMHLLWHACGSGSSRVPERPISSVFLRRDAFTSKTSVIISILRWTRGRRHVPMRVELCTPSPQKRYVEVIPPAPRNVTSFENGVVADVIS